MEFVSSFFAQLITQTASYFGGSLGWAIVVVTILIRLVLLPLMLPSLKSQKKLTSLKPELDKLKAKYGNDKNLLNQKTLELYKQHQINPLGGCLPQIVQIGLFIVFYRVLMNTISTNESLIKTFFWIDLTKTDSTFILPVLAGVSQLILGLMLLPATDTTAETSAALETKTKKDDKQAEDMTQMAQTMQSQMVFLMPAMTFFMALRFPSGLSLYWVISTTTSLIQQLVVSGPGGLAKYLNPKFILSKINNK